MALPAPAHLVPRLGAVQRSDQGASALALRSQYRSTTGIDKRWDMRYQEWQDYARRYAKILGVVRFAAGIVADTAARCPLRIEERDSNGDWGESDEQKLLGIFDSYCNERSDPIELQRAHAWHYQVSGEMVQVVSDGRDGVDWGIYSVRSVDFDKPKRGLATIKLAPNGDVKSESAFVVPRKQVTRFWNPDEEWPALATSPMAATIEDLHRYYALNRYARRTVESRTAMNGMIWTPSEAHVTQESERTQSGASSRTPGSKFERDFASFAKRSFSDEGDIAEVVPFLVHWDKDGGAPVYVKLGEGLDPHGIDYRNEALTDFARGVNLPASLVIGGGPGDSNHWTEWLVDDKFFEFGIAWVLNRMCHQDLTRTFLLPHLTLNRLPTDRFRVGYDKQPVIVKPDQSEHALKLYLAGLLNGVRTLEAANFDPEDIMGKDELAKLVELAGSRKTAEEPEKITGGPAPGDTSEPKSGAEPTPLPKAAAPEPPPSQSAPHPSVTKVNRTLAKLAQNRRDLGRTLLANAELSFAEAMRHAGVKVAVRARRASAVVRKAAIAAVQEGAPMKVHLAAIGLTEREALDHAFESYGALSLAAMEAARRRRQAILDAAGFDPTFDRSDERTDDLAAKFLVASLTALAFTRLTSGHPTDPPRGEVTGVVPARIITEGLAIEEGALSPTFGEGADVMPTVHETLDFEPIADVLSTTLSDEGVEAGRSWTWAWAFYGDPVTPCEVHQDLGLSAFTTTMPGGDLTDDVDPDLANPDKWPETDFLSPRDHDGCTCEWIEAVSDNMEAAI